MKRSILSLCLSVLLLSLLLSGCVGSNATGQTGSTQTSGSQPSAAAPQPSPSAAPTLTPAPSPTPAPTLPPAFDGERAYEDVKYQVDLGPRTPGSQPHAQTVAWMQNELEQSGWTVERQETTYQHQPVRNVIAKRGTGKPWIILGAHFDSRMKADQDPERPNDPVPAANDGASGIAVLLELARVLPQDLNKQIWLVMIDSEDQGGLPGWDWLYGSRAFVESLKETPDSVVIIDMIGDADLNIYIERNSTPALSEEIWAMAAQRGHEDVFIPRPKWNMIDDHTPFLEKGIHAVDIIDFDYPYWHTTQDTVDKVSAKSLHAVGDTLLYWLMK